MTKLPLFLLLCSSFIPAALTASEIAGKVQDPSSAPVVGAQVTAMNRLGVVAHTLTDLTGAFKLAVNEKNVTKLVIAAPGFQTVTVETGRSLPVPGPVAPLVVTLSIAPQMDSVTVTGSTMETPTSQQGSSLSILPRSEIESRNEASALDLLRYLPGLDVVETGTRGSLTSLYIRGGEANYNLVEIDGVPVNSFGGAYDFSQLPASVLDRVEVIRGAQSAVYGSYANGGVVNFVTRSPEASPTIDILAEGGTYGERRFALDGGGTLKGFVISAFATRMDTDGPVSNSAFRDEDVGLNLNRNFGSQSISFHGNFISSEDGVPGPYGSDPAHQFPGIDLISRDKNNSSSYALHYTVDASPRVREELFGTFFLNNNQYISSFPDAFNKDLRVQAESRTIISINSRDTLAAGIAAEREEVKNSYVTGLDGEWFLLPRTQEGIYVENRLQAAPNWFLNTGVRTEVIDTHAIPPGFGRPAFPANTIVSVNPKIATVYSFGATRVHASFGTGIRPPAAFDIAFTNNPALKPETNP